MAMVILYLYGPIGWPSNRWLLMTRNVASINGELCNNFIQCQWLVNFPVRLVFAMWGSTDRGNSGGGFWLVSGEPDYRPALPGWVTVDLSGTGENSLMAWRMGGRWQRDSGRRVQERDDRHPTSSLDSVASYAFQEP